MDSSDNKDFKERTLRTLKQGLGRLWKRRSVTITEYDPSYKVVYLGNVLTGWAKGEGCVEKPLCTLWKNYTSSSKPDVHMKVTVTQAGLKAVTKEHGLTEYWSHRITYCAAPPNYPKVFCWVYRHEGRKLKQELRCHAVLCSKESTARRMVTQLNSRLAQALTEFKRDKISRQNARLSLANSVYENPSLPRRKILLSTGSHNYRPPLERSKSAPKLMSIEESLEEEDEFCGDPRRSMRRTRPSSQKEEAFKKARRLSCGGLSERLMKIDTSILRSFGENKITNSSSEMDLVGNLTEEMTKIEEIDDKTVIINPSGGDATLPRVMKRSMSLQSHVSDDDITTDGECDDDISRLYSISDDELETASKISEEDCFEEDTCSEKTIEDVNLGVSQDFVQPENDNCYRISWGEDIVENRLRDTTIGDNLDTDLELDSLSMESRTNSLVRDRRKMFEKHLDESGSLIDKVLEKDCLRTGMLVQNRRKLFENILNPELQEITGKVFQEISEQTVLDLDRLNRSRMDKGYIDMEEDSTPSLQSISSGSDTSTSRVLDFRVGGVKPNYDLDSLSEEDSDESGYVESVPTEGDDKVRDLPHHQLMKSCILTPKTTHCVQV
uniref:PID domain-containing protein n=1 Tax=Graphocephala atropunctata TaxID=36148 RepID=A0A1B6M9Q2_9HEMI